MKILVVEDHASIQQSLCKALRHSLYAVDLADDGEEGLYKALNFEYDAIILDVMLPKIDGWELLNQLRAKKSTPVLMLTARDTLDDRVHGLDLGADDYIPKPFQIPELLARLRAVIRRSAGQASGDIYIGDYKLDTKSKTISLKGEAISLTAREYTLVEYLSLHQGSVISRAELYEHLFDENDSTLSNVLDVLVSRIRSKLDKDLIATHRGQGYSIGIK